LALTSQHWLWPWSSPSGPSLGAKFLFWQSYLCTVVRTVYGNCDGFEVKVGMHQGSALSPLLFVIVMEALSREFGVALP